MASSDVVEILISRARGTVLLTRPGRKKLVQRAFSSQWRFILGDGEGCFLHREAGEGHNGGHVTGGLSQGGLPVMWDWVD